MTGQRWKLFVLKSDMVLFFEIEYAIYYPMRGR